MPKKLFSKLLIRNFQMLTSANSQSGQSTAYVVLIIIVIIFAVMMSGGGGRLLSGNLPSSVTDTPTPPGGDTPTPTASSSATWNIAVTLNGCQQGKSNFMAGSVKVDGPINGAVELMVGSTVVGTQPFTAPSGSFPLTLLNSSGFNTKSWKINVKTGSTVQKTYDGNPTGC